MSRVHVNRRSSRWLPILGLCVAEAAASAGREAVDAAGCIGCHAPDENRIGPSYQAIAARYANGDGRVTAILARKVIGGGAGNWGVVPMIAHDDLSLDQAREMVDWILRQRVISSP